jgi:hypothetical protein
MMHREAYCLMKYRTDDGSEEEMLWNSRDGVTPFTLNSKSGKRMSHVEWNSDRFDPNFDPPPGSRIFVDATLQLVKPELEKYIDRIWNQGARETFGTKAVAFKRLLDDWLREGAPWVITVAERATKDAQP